MVGERGFPEIEGFSWSDETSEHLARHDVTPADVEAVLAGRPILYRTLTGHAATWAMVGRDARGRSLIIYIVPTVEVGI